MRLSGLAIKSVLIGMSMSMISLTGCEFVKYESSIGGIHSEKVITPDQAFELLKEGNQRFIEGKLSNKPFVEQRKQLVLGQHPIALIITCSDSRVAPELVFDQSLGDIFVIRIAGNITDDNVLGSVEYAVDHLDVPLIMVMGHENCGAVIATLNGKNSGYLRSITDKIRPVAERVIATGATGDELINKTIIENVEKVEAELKMNRDIHEKLMNGQLKIVGGEYRLESGKVDWFDAQ